jgi:hypothetical protein
MNKKLTFLLALLFLCGCAHRPAPADPIRARAELGHFLPLQVGNRWVYQTSFQGQPQPDLVVNIVAQEGGAFLDDRPTPSRYVIDGEGIRDGATRYLLKLPLKRGNRWMSVADVRTVEHYEIVAERSRVRVPAGEFSDCVVVRMEVRLDQKRAMRNYLSFAPEVGIIEISTVLIDGERQIPQAHLQLKEYSLQPSPQP